MNEGYKQSSTANINYFVIAAMTAAWISAAWTGFMLGVVPYSTGGNEVILGLTRAEWGIIHSWLSVIAVGITAVEIIISRKSLREGLIYLTEPER
ncbi:MAG: hypothetical protein AB1598_03320 [Thermodesulfobacteriota bacterium]